MFINVLALCAAGLKRRQAHQRLLRANTQTLWWYHQTSMSFTRRPARFALG